MVNPQHSKSVLVFGATGQQGGAVADALLADGWTVRALVRNPESNQARRLADKGVHLYPGDFEDSESIRNAMAGAYGVFSIQPSSGQGAVYGVTDEQEIRYGKNIADIAEAEGVEHLVYTSAAACGQGTTNVGHFDSKTAIEQHIRTLNLRSTIIRPAAFMELLMLPGMGLDKDMFVFFLRPDQPGQVIAVRDIGKITATLFAYPDKFAGRILEIAGDEVTGTTLQTSLTQAAGKPITYYRFPDSLLQENNFLARLSALIDDGRGAGNADIPALRNEFGPLATFDEWLAGEGKPLLENALTSASDSVSLR